MSRTNQYKITEEIVKGCKAFDASSQRQLYDATVRQLYNVVYRMIIDHHLTEDILQESYMKIFQKIDQFDQRRGKVFSWMCRICINNCINYLKKKRLVFEDQEQLFVVPDLQSTSLEKLESEYILSFIEQLPEVQRIIFNLYEIEGYKHSEIAEELGINVSTSRAYLSRAKLKLQQKIEGMKNVYNSKRM